MEKFVDLMHIHWNAIKMYYKEGKPPNLWLLIIIYSNGITVYASNQTSFRNVVAQLVYTQLTTNLWTPKKVFLYNESRIMISLVNVINRLIW